MKILKVRHEIEEQEVITIGWLAAQDDYNVTLSHTKPANYDPTMIFLKDCNVIPRCNILSTESVEEPKQLVSAVDE